MKEQRRIHSEQSVDGYLEQFPADIRLLAEKVRGLILKAVPDVMERVYPGWKIIGYRAPLGTSSCILAFLRLFRTGLFWDLNTVYFFPTRTAFWKGAERRSGRSPSGLSKKFERVFSCRCCSRQFRLQRKGNVYADEKRSQALPLV